MSGTTRYLYSDFADPEQGAALYTGGSPPGGYAVLTAAAGYAMANVLHDARYTVAKVTGTNGLIDIDLGQARPVAAFAMMNVYLDSGASFPTIKLYSSVDNSTWHDHGEVFNSAGWVGIKNRFHQLPAIYNRRYWRVHVTTGTDWYVGKIMLGKWIDFGAIHSPGSGYRKAPPRTRLDTPGGLPITHVLGQARERFENIYNLVTDEFRDAMVEMSAGGKAVGYVHSDDVLRHVILTDADGIPTSRIAAACNVWALSVSMESLP